MSSFKDSYVGQLRQRAGDFRLMIPAVRAVIQDSAGRILLIRRKDNDMWALPAGSLELEESVLDCLKREVREETGLQVTSSTPIAIYSEPRFAFTNMYGDDYQMFALVFRVDQWTGVLNTMTDETVDARFFPMDALPQIPSHHDETLDDLLSFNGSLIVK